jgi:hypothetical protein
MYVYTEAMTCWTVWRAATACLLLLIVWSGGDNNVGMVGAFRPQIHQRSRLRYGVGTGGVAVMHAVGGGGSYTSGRHYRSNHNSRNGGNSNHRFGNNHNHNHHNNNNELQFGKNLGKILTLDPDLRVPVNDMPFSARVKQALIAKGFESMTPIQSQCYESIFQGEDVIARSRTGTGKTFAFGIPLIEKVAEKGYSSLFHVDLLACILVVIVL